MALLEEMGSLTPDVVVEFSPPVQPCKGAVLRLWRGGLDLAGHTLSFIQGTPPEGVEELALMSLLWETGRISETALKIIPTYCGINCLDTEGQTTYNI